MSTIVVVSIEDNNGGVILVQENTLICTSRMILPINTPFLYSWTFIASTPDIILGGVTHKLPVIGSKDEPPPTGFVAE